MILLSFTNFLILGEDTYELMHDDTLVKCTHKQDAEKLNDNSFM